MRGKALVFSLVAAVSLTLVMAITAVTAYALVVSQPDDTVTIEQTTRDVAPMEAASPVEAQPVVDYKASDYDGGCGFYKSRLQMTEAPANDTLEDDTLVQLAE